MGAIDWNPWLSEVRGRWIPDVLTSGYLEFRLKIFEGVEDFISSRYLTLTLVDAVFHWCVAL